MGDIIWKVKLCGLTRDGKLLKPISERRNWPEVEALVDTGATASVISTTLAKLAGAEVMAGVRTYRGTPRNGALVVLQLAGCKPSYHLVVVDDRLAAQADPAGMILGHDYLQDNRARIDYDNGAVVQCPQRKAAHLTKRRAGGKTAKAR